MIKKIAVLLLVCSMIAALAACGGNTAAPAGDSPAPEQIDEGTPQAAAPEQTDTDKAYEAYSLIAEKLSAKTGEDSQYDIDFIMSMKMLYMGETMDFDMTGNIKMKVENELVKYSMVMDMGEMGAMEMYCDGEKAYYVVDGEVTEIDMALLMEQITSSVNIPEFEKAAIKSGETEVVEDGILSKIVIDGKALTDFIADALGEDLSAMMGDTALSISDISMEILTDNDGNPKTMGMTMSMSMEAEGESIEIDAVYEYIFNNLGSGVEIDLSAIAV